MLRGNLAAACVALACGASCDPVPSEIAAKTVTLRFSPDAPAGGEAYSCFGFDAGPAAGGAVVAIDWSLPDGAVAVHHAKLYALAGDYPDGPVACDGMPSSALPLHVWLPGGGGLRLPDGVGVAIPAETSRFVIEAHAWRLGDGAPGQARAMISLATQPPARTAGWTALGAPVPPLPPGQVLSSSQSCTLPAPLHIYLAWPHMHLLGQSFQSVLRDANGTATALLDVPVWDFNHQVGATLDVDAAAGDAVDVTCTWRNGTDHYVLPGARTTDEMCAAGFVAWPPGPRTLCPSP
jgi:hypothetical protein